MPVESIGVSIEKSWKRCKAIFLKKLKHTHIDTMEDLTQHLAELEQNGTIPGWIFAGWCGDDSCEEMVKEQTKFTSRNILDC